jgi:hypothetical protein
MPKKTLEERLLDPDTLANESLRFYGKTAAKSTAPTLQEGAEHEAALLDPNTLINDIALSHPGSQQLERTIGIPEPPDKA